jgi:exosortase A
MSIRPESFAEATSVTGRARTPILSLVIFAVLLAAIFVAYRATWGDMIHLWNTSDTYAHGWLIAPVSLWCLFQMRDKLALCKIQPAWTALPLLFVTGLGWSLGALADVQLVQQLSVVALVISAALLVFGWECCRTAAFPLGFLLLAVPMGDELTPVLVDMTADFVVFAVQATGIPLYREGNSFVIPSGSWSVVSGCSGIRYLMATITIGVLFSYLNYRSWGRRIGFVGIAILVAILANWLRAWGIVMIAHFSDMKLALGVDHVERDHAFRW